MKLLIDKISKQVFMDSDGRYWKVVGYYSIFVWNFSSKYWDFRRSVIYYPEEFLATFLGEAYGEGGRLALKDCRRLDLPVHCDFIINRDTCEED